MEESPIVEVEDAKEMFDWFWISHEHEISDGEGEIGIGRDGNGEQSRGISGVQTGGGFLRTTRRQGNLTSRVVGVGRKSPTIENLPKR